MSPHFWKMRARGIGLGFAHQLPRHHIWGGFGLCRVAQRVAVPLETPRREAAKRTAAFIQSLDCPAGPATEGQVMAYPDDRQARPLVMDALVPDVIDSEDSSPSLSD
jgi:hypothetical protein